MQTSAWGFRRCSFRLTGQCESLYYVERVTRLAPRFLCVCVNLCLVNLCCGSQAEYGNTFMVTDIHVKLNQNGLRLLCRISLFLFVLLFVLAFSSCRPGNNDNDSTIISTIAETPTNYHFMVENSGSVKGYFKGNSKAKAILKNLYDRLDEQLNEDDTITLNYINTSIVPSHASIEPFLQQTWSKCTASFTKLDDILSMAFSAANSESVTLLVSDYCFASNVGSLETAKSGITNLFTKGLKDNTGLSVAILKFNSDFNGKYYPGGLLCKQNLPFYVWVFGNAAKVKKVIELPNIINNGILVLQPTETITPEIQFSYARMKGKSASSVKVSRWKKDRHNDTYSLTYKFPLSNIIMDKDAILNRNAYKLPLGYIISNIEVEKDTCTMTIATKRPSPGKLCIEYQSKLPNWVEESNFEGTGVPPEGKTLGVKSLIEGVYNAYINKDNNIFTINITLQ